MNLYNYKFHTISNIENNDIKVNNESVQIDLNKSASSNSSLNSYEYREPEIFGITLKDWRDGVEQAMSEINPDRVLLCDVYNAEMAYDSQIIASVNQRKLLTVQGELAFYNENGEVNEEASKLIKSPSGSTKEWFRNFLNYSMDSIFYGFELITINNNKGEIIIKKIPERNVIPHLYSIIKDARYGNTPNNLIKYNEGSLDFITCKISYKNDLRDLGLLSATAPSFFSKCTGEWASHTRKYGMPVRVLKLENPNDANKMKGGHQALKNFQTGAFFTMSKNDDLEFHGDNSKGSEMYRELNIQCNNDISKIILGQTSSLDEKSYVGSAAVHESILGSIIKSDREFLESVVNSQLIPKLQIMGLLPNNIYFGISQNQKQDDDKRLANIKTIKDLGFKISKEFIKKNFDIELEDETNQTIEQDKEIIKEDNGENGNSNI